MTLDNDARYPGDEPTDANGQADAQAQAQAERNAPEQPIEPPVGSSYGAPGPRMAPNDYPQRPPYPRPQPQSQPPSPPYPQPGQFGQPYPQPGGYGRPYPPMYGPGHPEYPARRRGNAGWKWLGGCSAGCLGLLVLMALALACVVGGTAFAFFASTPASSTDTQTFYVSGTPTIRIRGVAGNIQVEQGAAGAVSVTAEKFARGWNDGDARQALRDLSVAMTQSGDVVEIEVHDANASGWGEHFHNDRHVNFTIVAPAQANLDATLAAGNVEVHDLAGTMTVQDDAGNIELDGVTLAGSSSLQDHAGNLDVNGALQSGASLDARTNAGNVNVTLPRATSAHLTATTHAGNVDIDSAWSVAVSRDLPGATASGDLGANPSGSLTLETDAGNVTLDAA